MKKESITKEPVDNEVGTMSKSMDDLYIRITSEQSRKAADALFFATTENLSKTYLHSLSKKGS
jgi:hypothetical protein